MTGVNEENVKKDPTKLGEIPSSPPFIDDPLNANEPQCDDGAKQSDLLYGIDDVPSWYMCIFLGFQVRMKCGYR